MTDREYPNKQSLPKNDDVGIRNKIFELESKVNMLERVIIFMNQWNNFRHGEENYEYYMSRKEVYNSICDNLN